MATKTAKPPAEPQAEQPKAEQPAQPEPELVCAGPPWRQGPLDPRACNEPMPETGSCPKCGSVSWKPARPPQRKPEPRPPTTQAEAQWAGYSRPEAFGPMDESPDGRMRRELDI